MTFDDFFKKGCYDGEIYKTVNTRNQAIAQYCKDSISIKKEQQKIEKQLKDVHTNIWNTKTVAEIEQDSINAAKETANDSIEGVKPENKPKSQSVWKRVVGKFSKDGKKDSKKQDKQEKVSKKKERRSKSSASSSGVAKVSVRRQRR